MNEVSKLKLRKKVITELELYNGSEPTKLGLDNETLEEILFDTIEKSGQKLRLFALPIEILKKIDYERISFKDVCIEYVDFTGLKNVTINLDEIYNKSLYHTKLSEVKIAGSFVNANIEYADFTGCSVKLIPQIVLNKSLEGAVLDGVTFTGAFDNTIISGANFRNSKNAIINVEKLGSKDLKNCIFGGVKFEKMIENTDIRGTDFTGSTKGCINLYNNLYDETTIFLDTIIVNETPKFDKMKIKC